MNTVKLSTKGQIILPKEIRNNLKLEPGTYFNIKTEKSNIILTMLKKTPLQQLCGKFKNDSLTKSLEHSHAEEISRENCS